MRNFIKGGNIVTLTAPADIASGAVVKVGNFIVVAQAAAKSGESFEGVRAGVFTVAKKGTDVIAQGDPLYWDDANKYLTKTSAAGLFLVGAAEVAAGNGVATVTALLDGVIRKAEA